MTLEQHTKPSHLMQTQSTDTATCGNNFSSCVYRHVTSYIAELDQHTPCAVYDTALSIFDRAIIQAALEACNNNKTHAAKLLGMSRGTLHKKIQQI